MHVVFVELSRPQLLKLGIQLFFHHLYHTRTNDTYKFETMKAESASHVQALAARHRANQELLICRDKIADSLESISGGLGEILTGSNVS